MLVHVIVLKQILYQQTHGFIYFNLYYNFFHFTLKHLSKLFYKIKGIFGRKDKSYQKQKWFVPYLMLHHKRNIEATSVFAFLIQTRYKNKGSSISSEVT